MDDRRDQVRGFVLADLDDELAQVRLDDIEPAASMTWARLISSLTIDLLLMIRFASWSLAMSRMIWRASSRIGGEVNVAAIFLDIRTKLLEVIVEIVQRMLLDVPGQRPKPVRIGQVPARESAGPGAAGGRHCSSTLELFVPGGLDAHRMEIKL